MKYSKINKNFVCKMAMLFAFVFAACSENNGSVAGGTVEETGVYALAGQVGAVAKMSVMPDSLNSSNVLSVMPGTVVKVFELDSISLDTTGRIFVDTILDSNGHFDFKNLSLNSPYVRISVLDPYNHLFCQSWVAAFEGRETCADGLTDVYVPELTSIVDLRVSKNIELNILTLMKAPILYDYFVAGMSFAEAGEKAERDILESHGIYKNFVPFETPQNECDAEFMRVKEFISTIHEDVNMYFMGDTNTILLAFEESIDFYAQIPRAAFSSSKENESLYERNMSYQKLNVGFIAKRQGLEQCTDSREGETAPYGERELVCRSGKWELQYKRIEFTSGTMVDDRDGKSYKTVTYNINGKPQTWMAENLNFDGSVMPNGDTLKSDLRESAGCLAGDEFACEVNGRLYEWQAAMNMDRNSMKVFLALPESDTVFLDDKCKSMIEDLNKCNSIETSNCGEKRRESEKYCKTLYPEGILTMLGEGDALWKWNYADYLSQSNIMNYQGICPDGWRLPNQRDWSSLYEYFTSQGVTVAALADEVATGFNMKSLVLIRSDEDWLKRGPNFVAVPDIEKGYNQSGYSSAVGWDNGCSMKVNGECLVSARYRYDFASTFYSVRCIKN